MYEIHRLSNCGWLMSRGRQSKETHTHRRERGGGNLREGVERRRHTHTTHNQPSSETSAFARMHAYLRMYDTCPLPACLHWEHSGHPLIQILLLMLDCCFVTEAQYTPHSRHHTYIRRHCCRLYC